MFEESLVAILGTKLRIRVLIVDGLGKNRPGLHLLGFLNYSPHLLGQKICVVFDPPHSLKSLRDAPLLYLPMLSDGTVVNKDLIMIL